MSEVDLASALAQFGAVGFIGWMWLIERKAAARREKQLGELHERLLRERTNVEVLISVVSGNTRALASLDAAQRRLVSAIDALLGRTICSETRAESAS